MSTKISKIFKLKESFFLSKHLAFNMFTFPKCKHIRVILSFNQKLGSLGKSKSLILFLEFLEQITGLRGIVKEVILISNEEMWIRLQVDLSGFYLGMFCIFFNEVFFGHPLFQLFEKLPKIKQIKENFLKLVILDLDLFFEISVKKALSMSNYKLEFDFFFENHFCLIKDTSIFFYSQCFFNCGFLECRKE